MKIIYLWFMVSGLFGLVACHPVPTGTEINQFNNHIISESGDTVSEAIDKSEMWFEGYSLETDTIQIYSASDDFLTPATITHGSDIETITSSVDFSSWESIDMENTPSESPYYYIDFCNGTVVSCLKDMSIGTVGTNLDLQRDQDGTLLSIGLHNSYGGLFTISDSFRNLIAQQELP